MIWDEDISFKGMTKRKPSGLITLIIFLATLQFPPSMRLI